MGNLNTLHGIFLILTLCWVTVAVTLPFDPYCPTNCECDFKTSQVNCSRLNLHSIPTDLPRNTAILILEFNHIVSVPPRAFATLPHLRMLDLSSNKLNDHSIVRDSFFNLTHLDSLDLSFNAFEAVPLWIPKNLTYFSFIQNNVRTVPEEAFANFTIFHLDLSYNPITGVHPKGFLPLKDSLVEIYLEFNNLTRAGLSDEVFSSMTKLQLLGLRFNPLAEIPQHLPPSVTSLDVVGTSLKRIPAGVLNQLTKLHDFASWQNPLEVIEDNAFAGLSQVTLMDMNSMRLTHLTNLTLAGLTSMETIYLYSNNISHIAPGAFHAFRAPKELWLSGNKLTTLDESFQKVFTNPSVTYIDLSFNPWVCDCNLRWLKVLQEKSEVISFPHLMTCQSPEKLRGQAWDTLSASDFICHSGNRT